MSQLDTLIKINPPICGGGRDVQFAEILKEGPVARLTVKPLELPKPPADVVFIFDPAVAKAEDFRLKCRDYYFPG